MPVIDILNVEPDLADHPPDKSTLPKNLLYTTSARLGGIGLDRTAIEGALTSYRHGFLGKAIAFDNRQSEIPSSYVQSLRWHPVRLASSLVGRAYYYGVKKHYADIIAALSMKTGKYDCFHGWSGDCLRALTAARQLDVPSLIEIPTWHRNRGGRLPFETGEEREALKLHGWERFKHSLLPSRGRFILEYELATRILVQSEMAANTFIEAGFDPRKIVYVARGVNPAEFRPAPKPPSIFRITFVGALIERKGVHHLLRAWKKLNLKDAELLLVGFKHDEMKPHLDAHMIDSVRAIGFSNEVEQHLQSSTAFVFPSEMEGSAKATYEAASCGLPIITTRESGDVVIDGETGKIVPANDSNALADAIKEFYDNRDKLPLMGQAGRRRIIEKFTWDHHRARLLRAYQEVIR